MKYLLYSEAIARQAVYLLFALAPIFFVPLPWINITQSKMLFVAILVIIGFLALVLSVIHDSKVRILKSSLLVASIAVPVAYAVSALAAPGTWESFVGDGRGIESVVSVTLLYLALFLTAHVLSRGEDRTYRALRLLLISGAILLIVQASHLAFPSLTLGGVLTTSASSIAGSWHDLAIFLGLLLFLSLTALQTSLARGYWRSVVITIALGSFVILTIINYRNVWIGITILFFAHAFSAYVAKRSASVQERLRYVSLSIVLGMVALLMCFVGTRVQEQLPTQIQISQFEVRPSWTGTLAIGREVFTAPTQLFFGSGPSTFAESWDRYKPLSVNATQFWNADFYYGVGLIPTSLVTTGFVGLFAWGAVCLALLWSFFKFIRAPSEDDAIRAILLGCALYLTAFHILYVPGPLLSLLAFIMFGAIVAEEFYRRSIGEWVFSFSPSVLRGKTSIALVLIIGALVIFGGAESSRALLSDALVSRAAYLYDSSGDISKAARSLSTAITIWPRNDRAHRAGVELGLLQLSKLAASNDSSDEAKATLRDTLAATIQHGLTAVSLESNNYQNWLALARLYSSLSGVGIEGAESKAREAYAKVREKNPTNPLSYLGEAELYIRDNDDAGARKNLEETLRIKPDLSPALYLLSQVEARAGNLEKAATLAEGVTKLAPGDALGWYNLGTIYYAENKYQEASFALERAVSLQNDYANALFLLGLAYYKLDRKSDALRTLETVEKLNPSDTALSQIIKLIRSGHDPFKAAR